MADLIDVVRAVQASGTKMEPTLPSGAATTASSIFAGAPLGEIGGLKISESRFFPTPPTWPNGRGSDDPEKPEGALEVTSVTQKTGAALSYAPVQKYTYQVRGRII